eukprot:GILJ01014531.1.p1 GENE.GILJ01014531.1~~GILJ01014531.1.p1  ORF type:complete len:274 (+),score=49.78 GILJ01014531.1:211-1032(+)
MVHGRDTSKGQNKWTKQIDERDVEGSTAIGVAVQNAQADTVEMLIKWKADVNASNKVGWTPLHHATRMPLIYTNRVIECLIAAGAKLNVANKFGATPLQGAAIAGNILAANILISHGSDLNASENSPIHNGNKLQTTSTTTTALHSAASQGRLTVLAAILSAGADVDGHDDKGRTALHVAAEGGHLSTVEALIQEGANVWARDKDGITARELAIQTKGAVAASNNPDDPLLKLLAQNETSSKMNDKPFLADKELLADKALLADMKSRVSCCCC